MYTGCEPVQTNRILSPANLPAGITHAIDSDCESCDYLPANLPAES